MTARRHDLVTVFDTETRRAARENAANGRLCKSRARLIRGV